MSGKIFLIACVINKNEITFCSCVLKNVVNLKLQLHFILISLYGLFAILQLPFRTAKECEHLPCWIRLRFNINKHQLDSTVCRYLFTAESLYMFRMSPHPSSGVLKTVTAASGTGHNIGEATSLQRVGGK